MVSDAHRRESVREKVNARDTDRAVIFVVSLLGSLFTGRNLLARRGLLCSWLRLAFHSRFGLLSSCWLLGLWLGCLCHGGG